MMALSAQAGRKMNVVKIQSGETFGDATAQQSLSDKHPGSSGISLEVIMAKGKMLGVFNPKLKNWSKAETLVVKAHNPSQKFLKFMLTVIPKDMKGQSRYDARSDSEFVLKPGDNTIPLELGDFVSNAGTPLDMSDILQFYFVTETECTIYFQKLYLTFP